MVLDPAGYKWSSYPTNALGVKSTLCCAHRVYLSLGKTETERMKAYRALFETEISQTLIGNIQYCSKKELVLGNNKFKQQIENLTGIALKNERLGRPPQNEG
ncbi:hypothetical protein A6F57_04810 [Alteromonas stellipolaris]|uniref:hypothetical protein n=1 Tax=Alteromonas stellipolaris TaxID=233316 RepID=UPI0007B43F11|nr:hypothetical protein [Alteromonas stellipolaris]ANB24589.1 hypothetical protein A6F57_04810 [Alteromonas stellipolaris]